MRHTLQCATAHVPTACIGGAIFTGLNVMQGARLTPRLAVANVGFLYAFGALICPMEELHQRRSLAHNFISGATLGYLAVAGGHIGIPFGFETAFIVQRIPLPLGGALVYGGIAAAIAGFQGKSL